MKIKTILLLAVAFILPASPAAESFDQVKVGFYPYGRVHEISADGSHSGLGYEVMELIAGKVGWTNQYIGHDRTWSESERMLEDGELDILDCVRKAPGRDQRYEFSALPTGFSFCLIVVRTNETRFVSGEYVNWGRPKVGAMKNEAVSEEFAFYASTHGFEYDRCTYPTAEDALAALQAGEIDMAVMESTMYTTDFRILESINPRPYYLCTKKGNRALMDEIDRAMAVIYKENPGWYHDICRRYYSREDIIVYLPRVHRGGETRLRYLKAMADLLAAIGGWNPIFRECAEDFSDADFSVPSIAAHVNRTPENLARFDFPFITACRRPVCLYASAAGDCAATRPTAGLPRDRIYNIGYVENETAWRKCFLDYARDHKLAYTMTPFASVRDTREAVRTGKVDLALLGRRAEDPDGIVRVEDCGSVEFDFATPRSQPALRNLLDISVRYMRYHERVFIRHIERYAYGIEDESRVVRAGVYPEFGALEIAPDGTVSGYIADYLREVAKTEGWDLIFVPMTYGEAFEALAEGDVDIVGFSSPYPEVSDRWDTSRRDAGIVRYALKVKADSPLLANRPDLWNGERIGYLAGSRPVEELRHYLDSLGAKYRLVPYTGIRDALADIEGGRLEGIFTVHARESKNYRTIAIFPLVHTLFCTNRRRPEVKAQLDRAMDTFAAQNMDFNWWLNHHYLRSNRELLTMDADEVEFIKQNRDREFVVHCPRNLPPVASWNERTQTAGGFLAELFRRIGKELGLRFRLTGGGGTGRADVYVVDREINAIDEGMIVDQDWFPIPTVKISLPEDRIPAAARGIWAVERQRKGEIEHLHRNNRKTLLVDTKEECYRAVAEGRAEATIDNMGTARLMIDEHRAFRDLHDTRIDSREWARQVTIAFPADGSPELRRLFQKARTSISDTTAEQLFLDAIIDARRGRYTTEDIILYGVVAVAFAFILIAFLIFRSWRLRLQLEHGRAETRSKALDRMSGNDCVFLVDCVNGMRRTLHDRSRVGIRYSDAESYPEAFARYIDEFVAAADRERMRRFANPEYLLKTLAGEDELRVEFRDFTSGMQRFVEMRLARYSATEVLQSFREDDHGIFNRKMLERLEDKFFAIFAVDLDTGMMQVMKDHSRQNLGPKGTIRPYEPAMRNFAAQFPEGSDPRAFFEKNADVEFVRRRFAHEDRRTFQYSGAITDSTKWCNVTELVLERREDGTPSLFVFGFGLMDDDAVDRIKMQEKLKVALSKAEEAKVFANYFIDTFVSTYLVNLDTGRFKIHSQVETLKKKYPLVDHFQQAMDMYADKDVHPDDYQSFKEFFNLDNLKKQLKERTLITYSYRDISDGVEKTYGARIVRGEDEHIAAFAFADITDETRKEQEHQRELKMALEQADIANRSKTSFLFNMSHDIRTPMNAIIGFSDIALKRIAELECMHAGCERLPDLKGTRDCVEKINSAGTLLLSIINSILDMSRIESGKAKLEESEEDVLRSFAAIESTMHSLAFTKSVELTFTYGEVRDRYVYVDRERCMRVFVNLISNAIKYSKDNGYVKVRCEQVGEKKDGRALYRYTFEDNGIGMSEEYQKHLYENFSREQNSTTRGIQGTGLGLSLCKTFIDLMGGTIECKSKQGEGTTFTVELPFRVREDVGDSHEANDGGKAATTDASLSPLGADFAGQRVLLVEDNELNREVAEFLLKEQGFEVDTAEDGSIAVKKVKAKNLEHYDYILMDIQMPIMGGYEATRAIRAFGFKRPIIALSANAFAEDKAASLAAGMDDHVAKPIKLKELMAAIAKFGHDSRAADNRI